MLSKLFGEQLMDVVVVCLDLWVILIWLMWV